MSTYYDGAGLVVLRAAMRLKTENPRAEDVIQAEAFRLLYERLVALRDDAPESRLVDLDEQLETFSPFIAQWVVEGE